ncbi:hypothetical protein [Fusobacterium sp.]|uniref:hypothetical protein n=1 Tax=Fusobacterium sp. TaxID=68766 RepID=UPI00396C9411
MEIKENSYWINKKNKRRYQVVKEAIDCTNERDGLSVIVYTCGSAPGKLFVRDKNEFLIKFIPE